MWYPRWNYEGFCPFHATNFKRADLKSFVVSYIYLISCIKNSSISCATVTDEGFKILAASIPSALTLLSLDFSG